MDIKGGLKRLLGDAVLVWSHDDTRRPFTRRGPDDSALREEYRQTQKSGDDDDVPVGPSPGSNRKKE